jgi:transcriptional regulator with XRE-family HTH domain
MSNRKANPIDAEVGRRIKLQRLSAGLSQTTLGIKIGVTFQQVQKYERGQTRIGASRLTALARALNVPVSTFFDGAEKTTARRPYARLPIDLLSEPQALKLLQAFADLANPNLRQSIVQLLQNIRENCRPAVADSRRRKTP